MLTKLERLQMKRRTYATELDSCDRSRAVDVIHEARHSTYQYRVDATLAGEPFRISVYCASWGQGQLVDGAAD